MSKVLIFDIDFVHREIYSNFKKIVEEFNGSEGDCIFFTRSEVLDKLSKCFDSKSRCIFIEDFFTHEELEFIDETASYLIKNWSYHSSLKIWAEKLKCRGIELIGLWQYELTHSIPFILKRLKFIKKIFEEIKPNNLRVFTAIDRAKMWHTYINQVHKYCKSKALVNIDSIDIDTELFERKHHCNRFKTCLWDIIADVYFLLQLPRRNVIRSRNTVFFEDTRVIRSLFNCSSRASNFAVIFFSSTFSKKILQKIFRKEISFFKEVHLFFNSSLSWWQRTERLKIIRFSMLLWENIRENEDFKNFFRYEGMSVWPLIESEFRKIFLDKISERIKLIQNLFFWLKKFKPALIVLQLDNAPFERTLCEVARIHGIRTLVVQHGIQAERRGHDVIYADLYAMWGIAHKQRYIGWGNEPEKIIITGNPAFDRFSTEEIKKDIREAVFDELGLDKNKKLVVLATRTNWPLYWFSAFRFADSETMHLKELVRALDFFDDMQLVLKVHPGEIRDDMYERVLNSFSHKTKVRITKNINLDRLISASDLVVSTGSTVALEAMILKKPVLIINFTSREDLIPYAGEGGALGVYKKEELPMAIERIFGDNDLKSKLVRKRENFIRNYAFAIDGQSSKRVWTVISQMINR